MNNRYTFRGKGNPKYNDGEWYYGYLTYDGSDYRIAEPKYGCCKRTVIPETVGQCTGRKYANDKLLFEGDIVKWYSDYDDTWGYSHTAEYYGVVVWNANDYCWNIKTNDELIPFNDYDWDISMVVGNIHDNPELLEVER